MKRLRFSVILMAFIGFTALAQQAKNPAIIPQPSEISWSEKYYSLPENATICYNAEGKTSALWLQQLLKNTSSEVNINEGDTCGDFNIILDKNLSSELGKEGYQLEISSEGINLKAATENGLFYAIQSLRQILPEEIEAGKFSEEIQLKHVKINDTPKYEWRGSMIDLARSFFGPEYIKKHLDRMALYKLNRLHLHLTDDQGWRIEIKNKPKLTEIGSKGAVKGGRSGFLTQEEYKEIQEYAAARKIMIIPEIDMPGHIYAALVSYPELNCEDFSNLTPARATPPELFHEYNVGWTKLCLDKPEVYDFVSEVIEELAEITTGPYIHIGGDEIKDERYEEFVVKADSIVRKFGKTSIGWEEVTKAKVDKSLISQVWNGHTESIVDVKIIQSMCSNFYFDHANIEGQEFTNNWCKEDGVSLEDAYDFSSENPNVIGVEAPVWTEKVLSDAAADDRFWPRTIALAEIGWSEDKNREFKDFIERLGHHGKRLDNLKVNYYRSPEVNWNSERGEGVFSGFNPGIKE